jgi:hypothetical protein
MTRHKAAALVISLLTAASTLGRVQTDERRRIAAGAK